MNVKGIKRAEDLPFKVPKPLAEAVNDLEGGRRECGRIT